MEYPEGPEEQAAEAIGEPVNSHKDRFIVLLSHERSGSHFVTDLLASTGQVHSFDEVCNFNAVDPETAPASFFGFRRRAQEQDPDILLRPSVDSGARLLDGYLHHLTKLAGPRKKLLIDIKYGHVHNFEIGWWPSERRPFLIGWLARHDIPVLHLTRRNSVAAAVSNLIAEKTQIWHRKEEAREHTRVRIAVQRAVHEALLVEREKDNYFNWLTGVRHLPLEYEQIAGNKSDRDAVMARACDFIGVTAPEEFHSSRYKVTAPLSDAVENYTDLLRCVQLFGNGRLRLDI
jgi:LPS sulfotransferase NodH